MRRGKKTEKKHGLSPGCPSCHPISYASGLCLCAREEGGKREVGPSGAD